MASWLQKTFLTAEMLRGFIQGNYQLLRHQPQPQRSGQMQLQGLHAPVKVFTDRYGIPHIYAQNEEDLFFAQGAIHARERLWQMELNRRIGSGRLSELFGSVTLEVDRFIRRIGMHRAAQNEVELLSDKNKCILGAYAQGINSFIQHNHTHLPVEFTFLNLKPQPWQIADTLLWGKLQGWGLSGNWEIELIRAQLISEIGPERAARLEAGYDANHPLILPPGTRYQGLNPGLFEQYDQIKTLSGFGTLGGSNNWVVDGTMTQSGSAILCNDPHLGQSAPSIWFACHLVAGPINVAGASFPGSPGIIIGHNQHIAWGITNAVSDVQDLYAEKFQPENPHLYEYKGEWEEAKIIREEIMVQGQDSPVIEEVRITRHGPIITTLPPVSASQNGRSQTPTEVPLALHWTGLQPSRIITAVNKLQVASNWQEFCEALRDWDVPPQNFVYADKEGNIGYIMAGDIPIRAHGETLTPQPGWTGTQEWTGMIPFEELPQTYNPKQHCIVTANNRVVDDNYPYYISHEWLNGYRAERICNLLTSKEQLTPDDMATIQMDQYAAPATEIVPVILQLKMDTPLKHAIHEILRAWDYQLTAESIAASIYTTFLRKLERIVFSAVIGDSEPLLHRYLGKGLSALGNVNGNASRSKPLLLRLLQARDDNWFAQSAIPNGPTSWQEALERAFTATIETLRDQHGSNVLHWQYGTMHTITYNHPLGMVKALRKIFNRGPFPYGGDNDTVNMGSSSTDDPQTVTIVPSFRQIIDLANLSRSRVILSPGQSGIPTDTHYDDMDALWRTGASVPLLYTETEIQKASGEPLALLPDSPS
ncbi:MAG TPA: penicillin acylase family protein [Dictyobacter sp.]|jgi:penicillin amidase|nr:penicillin acylase family protein [Dictyobacter sp.]